MSNINRRRFLQMMGMSTAAAALAACDKPGNQSTSADSDQSDIFSVPMKGEARILHTTDLHGQLFPVYFREPNVNLGMGEAFGRPPHMVGAKLMDYMGLTGNEMAKYAYTYQDFDKLARQYGRMGGYAHIKTLLDRLREQAGGKENTLTLDGGDLWQGSGTALWTRGVDMVEASNILGLDVMVGHWEFTYKENEVLSNVALFKGDFIGQNVRVKEDALFGDEYTTMVEKYDGNGLYDENNGHAFRPYVIKEVNGRRIAVVGQAFPRTANANPQEFFPDWSFGLREDDMRDLIKSIRENEKPDALVMVSHNGMDVDVKMAENCPGIDIVFGGHTHDGMPKPLEIKDTEGGKCWVSNAGSNGKYVGVCDFQFDGADLKGMNYQMLPVMSEMLPKDGEMDAYLKQMRSTVYDENIVESRRSELFYNKDRVGKTFDEILNEKLAKADRTLYRRGNFMGTWDQVICNALRKEYDADVAFSAGVRWGVTTLEGDWITMDDVMTQCALTYGETYVQEMTGEQILNIMEQVADNLFDPDPYLQSGGDMVRVGGLDYTIEPAKGLYKRITNATLDNGEALDPKKTYKVTGWAVVGEAPEGRLIWDIVRDYILSEKGEDDVLHLPKINHPTLIGVLNDPGIADYPGKAS